MQNPRRLFSILPVLIGTHLIVACAPTEAPPPKKLWREELTVIVAQHEKNVDAEFERQLVDLFAKQLPVKLRLLPLPLDQVIPALETNQGHIAAAGIRSNESYGLQFGPIYQTVQEQIVCSGSSPRHIAELVDKVVAVAAGSAQEAVLRGAKKTLPALEWDTRLNQTAADLLAEVAAGELECTLANEEQVALARNFHSNLKSAFTLAVPSRLAWVFATHSDPALVVEVQNFFTMIKRDGTLSRLIDRYYGHNERVGSIDAVAFITKMRTVLPNFQGLFKDAAALTGLDWRLVAAVAYQESHWDPLATSYTNVRGMMMLTEDTADRMNVTNRLDARQSIMAGARYLQLLKEQLPLRIEEPDRTWLALASYNQGYGHLEDARVLAKKMGYNPDKWADVKKVMPLLAQPEYFLQAKYGQARGGEAVIFVETVRMYDDMLKHLKSGDEPFFRLQERMSPFSFSAQ